MFESRFQSFADVGGPANGAARVAELRRLLEAQGLSGFIVPRADEHQNEYVPANAERLMWLTGFAGSAGVAIVLKDKAALFVDGRYTEQAKAQVDGGVFAILHVVSEPPTDWLTRGLRAGDRFGYDPRLHTPNSVRRLSEACAAVGAELVATSSNPVDAIWRDRPNAPMGLVTAHKTRFAGEPSVGKVARVKEALKRADGLLVSDPSNLAWLFNIRGADVSHTPLPLGYAYVPRDGRPVLLINSQKVSPSVRDKLGDHVELADPDTLIALVERLGGEGAHVAFDAATAPALLTQTLERAGGKADVGADPISLMKAAKNKAELVGARAAHERDGAALARFLAWFDAEAPRGRLTEIDAVEALEVLSAADGGAERHFLSDHCRGWAELGVAPLSGQRGEQPDNRTRNFPRRQRWPIRGRDDRRHADDISWTFDRVDAGSFYSGSEGPHRDCRSRFSARREWGADRRPGA